MSTPGEVGGRLRIGSATDTGRVRDHNEDAVLAEGTVFVVADGMGGHAAGDVAALRPDLQLAVGEGVAGRVLVEDRRPAAAVSSWLTQMVGRAVAGPPGIWVTGSATPEYSSSAARKRRPETAGDGRRHAIDLGFQHIPDAATREQSFALAVSFVIGLIVLLVAVITFCNGFNPIGTHYFVKHQAYSRVARNSMSGQRSRVSCKFTRVGARETRAPE